MSKVIRRTKEEIKAGFPHELKMSGINFETWLLEKKANTTEKPKKEPKQEIQKKPVKIAKVADPEEVMKKVPIVVPFPEEQPQKGNIPKIKEIIKETVIEKIIVKTKDNEDELKNLMKEALDTCRWEWLHIPLDDKFRQNDLNKHGKDGWKFAFILEKTILPTLKNDIICFQRPLQKKGAQV